MEREILFLEKKVAEAGSTLFSLLKDESLLSLVQMAKMQNQTNCLYVSKPSTALAVNTLEACVSIFSRYLKIMVKTSSFSFLPFLFFLFFFLILFIRMKKYKTKRNNSQI